MLSSRPYLARALYEWLLDNDHTPYVVVDAEREGVQVPGQFVQNGQIVLNISPSAVRDLQMDNEAITFNARFGGQPMQVIVPSEALIALYARENGVGMVFGHEPVMPGYEALSSEEAAADQESERPSLEGIDGSGAKGDGDEPDTDEGKKDGARKGRPSLRVIK